MADGGVAGILEAVTFVQGARIIALVLYARRAGLLSVSRPSWESLQRLSLMK